MKVFAIGLVLVLGLIFGERVMAAVSIDIEEVKKYEDGSSDVRIKINQSVIEANMRSSEVMSIKGLVQQLVGNKDSNDKCMSMDNRSGMCVTSVQFVGCGTVNYEAVLSSDCNPTVTKNDFARCCVKEMEIEPINREELCRGKMAGYWCGEGSVSGTCQNMGDKLICVIKTPEPSVASGVKCKKDASFFPEVIINCANKKIGDLCKIKTFGSERVMSGTCKLDKIIENGDCFCYVKELAVEMLTPTPVPSKKPGSIIDGAPDYSMYFDVNGCTRTGCRARCCDKTPPAPALETNGSGCRRGWGLFPYCKCGGILMVVGGGAYDYSDEKKYENECKFYDFGKGRKEDKDNPDLNFNNNIDQCNGEECNDSCKYAYKYSGKCDKKWWWTECNCYNENGKIVK